MKLIHNMNIAMVKSMRGGYVKPATVKKLQTAYRASRRAGRVFKKTSPIVKEALGELSITGALSALNKLEETMKQPKGANGLALGPTKLEKFANQSLDSSAVGSSTYSNTFYAFRPKVALKSPRQRYRYKTSILSNRTVAAGSQQVFDISLLDAVPVLNNPDSNAKYSNFLFTSEETKHGGGGGCGVVWMGSTSHPGLLMGLNQDFIFGYA